MKEQFEEWNPTQDTQDFLEQVESVLDELYNEGYVLSLRQLHYQLVSRDITPNTQKDYDRLGRVLDRARMAGLIDWEHIEDRHREIDTPRMWDNPGSILRSAAQQYAIDRWKGQQYHVEVWVEKDALTGIVQPVCRQNQVNYFACKGYISTSARYKAMERFSDAIDEGKTPVIIYMGDHDPSGLDMPSGIEKSLHDMMGCTDLELWHVALTKLQVEQYKPPPNFAKETDSRMPAYVQRHGKQCWELDALPPRYLRELTEFFIKKFRDETLYSAQVEIETTQRKRLLELASEYGSEQDE